MKKMVQDYSRYTAEDQETWGILFDRQIRNLQDKACEGYLTSLNQLHRQLPADAIPHFRDLDAALWGRTGWTIEVVPGLIPVGEFFELLSRRRFCSSTWIRSRAQLDYLEEPDMFHDIFGHVPLLMDRAYANAMQQFGELGMRFLDHPEILTQLERLYWYTIEFGLVEEKGLKIYGAGILSSFGESQQIYEAETVTHDFDLETILFREFRKDVMQSEYFILEDIRLLGDVMAEAVILLEKVRSPRTV